ncbi:M9 family metallopeptidase [Chitinimonas sp.]|uniref:M9 family metallopeptidase n=1 Tax=Chitinimonas sp. TaxID=1934313 RepID=UPI002F943D57
MKSSTIQPWLNALLLLSATALVPVQADAQPAKPQLPMPSVRQSLPPSAEQSLYNLAVSRKPRYDLLTDQAKRPRMAALTTADCQDMNKLASYSGNALANYLVSLPDYECHYGLFSLDATLATKIYNPANWTAVANRFVQEAAGYRADNRNLVNLLIYLRAGYYLADGGTTAAPGDTVRNTLRPAIRQLVDGQQLFRSNPVAPSTASETLKLITNQHDEAYHLGSMRSLVQRYTNSTANPAAAQALLERSASDGFTGVLTVFFYANGRPDAQALLQNDASYATALNNFVTSNKTALLGGTAGYQLTDAAREAFRFFTFPALKPTVKPMIQNLLATTSMTGNDSELWLAAAQAVKYYDNANCSQYGTCNFEQKLAERVLPVNYTCSSTLRIRAQDMTQQQLQDSCAALQKEEGYVHDMLQTQRKPVANDSNTALEVVVFDDYTNYSKYASVIYDIDTNNGGMYLEGNPAQAGNQARFVAHEASWLRPTFKIWNLEHEYVHYLDGRFDMYGDFAAATAKPTVWWIEGIAEYLSLKNNNQAGIDAARSNTYRLSQIFGNNYSMADYTNRAYRWGYMATRFMMERHRADVDAILTQFRKGDYEAYQRYMTQIGSRYDSEFVSWAQTAGTTGEPPMPGGGILPSCNHPYYLGKGCSIGGFASNGSSYAYLMLPAGARNLKVWTTGGSGDVDLYLGVDRYPTTSSYDAASTRAGNDERIEIASPTSGKWLYLVMQAKQPFSGVTINASYD